jgi:hypothetical protein
MQAKLRSVKAEMRRRMHLPIPEQGRWLAKVLEGHYRYYAVPDNSKALKDSVTRSSGIGGTRSRVAARRAGSPGNGWRVSPRDGYPNPGSFIPGRTCALTPEPKGGAQCVDAHAGICAGGAWQRASLPR